jgi:hypothetical protein
LTTDAGSQKYVAEVFGTLGGSVQLICGPGPVMGTHHEVLSRPSKRVAPGMSFEEVKHGPQNPHTVALKGLSVVGATLTAPAGSVWSSTTVPQRFPCFSAHCVHSAPS